MKNRLLKLTMIVVVAVGIILTIFRIGSSVFMLNGKTSASKHKNVIEIIRKSGNNAYKNEQIDYGVIHNHVDEKEIK